MQPGSRPISLTRLGFLFCVFATLNSLIWTASLPGQEPEAPPAAAATDAATDSGAPAAPETHQPESMLSWIIKSSGWIGAVILVLSFYFVATVTRLFMELKAETFTPPELLARCEELLKNRDYQGLYREVKQDESFFANVVEGGLLDLSNGVAEARETMDRVADTNTVQWERKISMLAVLGTLGPMIGLLGTLKGMIASFSVIAMSDTQLKASEVAGGISEALLLTFEGVGLSVPAIYFFAVFRNRVSTFSSESLLEADSFVRRVATAFRTKPVAPAQSAAPAAAGT